MKNSELRDYSPKNLLSGIDQQRQLILREYSVQQPCPNCTTRQNVFEGLGIDIDDYDTNAGGEKAATCTGCGRQLVLVVPFMKMAGPHWEWQLVPINLEKEVQS
jgi:hypothetical protein